MTDTAVRAFHGRAPPSWSCRTPPLRGTAEAGASVVLLFGGDAGGRQDPAGRRVRAGCGRRGRGRSSLGGRWTSPTPCRSGRSSALRAYTSHGRRPGRGRSARPSTGSTTPAAPPDRAGMLGELSLLVGRAARTAPVVPAVDDLHCGLLHLRPVFAYLLAGLGTELVLLVGTYRDDPAGWCPGRAAAAGRELRRHRTVTFRHVEPLTRAELAELVWFKQMGPSGPEALGWKHSRQRLPRRGDLSGRCSTATARGAADGAGNWSADRGVDPPARDVVRAVAGWVGATSSNTPLAAVVDRRGRNWRRRSGRRSRPARCRHCRRRYALRHGPMTEVVAGDLSRLPSGS
ncbi:hypothetical protein HBB16_13420 [Pseudonocardia sp. MCCB 268]|nr:hypothetical protein [Pseudonocardia cytotoxica]